LDSVAKVNSSWEEGSVSSIQHFSHSGGRKALIITVEKQTSKEENES